MTKFVEMDEKVTLKDQMEDQVSGQVILINKFDINPDEVDLFLDAWKKDATEFIEQPGFISTQLHRGIGNSGVFINYAVWESLKHYKDAFNKVLGSSMQSRISKYPDSMVVSPHLFKKIAVPGICGN